MHQSYPSTDLRIAFPKQWESSSIMIYGETIDLLSTPILIAFDSKPTGWLSYRFHSQYIEILSLFASNSDKTIEENLLIELEHLAKIQKVDEIRVTTSNANLTALQFYQQHHYSMVQLHPHAISMSHGKTRDFPQIIDGIKVQDEIVLKKNLTKAMDQLFLHDLFHVKHQLILKPLNQFDPQELIPLFSDPKVVRYQAMKPFETIADAQAYYAHLLLQSVQHKRIARGIFVDGKFAGIISLHQIHKDHCSLGYSLIPYYWKQGIATEAAKMMIHIAFDILHLRRIQAITHPDNIGSIRVLERLRFHPEGTLIEYICNPRTGSYENRESHALLQKNHQQKK
jgi:ribosomal-protein-alanine N-acetyltransferase